MSVEEKIKVLTDAVSDLQGCKGVDLAVRVAMSFLNTEEFMATLTEAVERGEIIEVEYLLPTMPYRTKSFYFPKGTEIHFADESLKVNA